MLILMTNIGLSNGSRSNSSFDVLMYSIHLDISDLAGKYIFGHTVIKLVSNTNNLKLIDLMLEKLVVDSVIVDGHKQSFIHLSPDLEITFTNLINEKDTIDISIYYGGVPKRDPSWGGFYFNTSDEGYAFNMGVGFVDSPHNYGRIWFPCKDDFEDKALYEYFITTKTDKKAVCSGVFIDSTIMNNSITWHWRLNQEIPTYLSSVAVGNYTFLRSIHKGMNKNIEILNACHPNDTQKFHKSFINLPSCIDIFEQHYAPYLFERVGYVVVPFNSGAMEHACNIAYPKYAVDGSLTYETLMAHEFSHHWWGNQVTCKTAEDMWLNEGWASYSEYLFLDKLYGKERYREEIQNNHKSVVQYAHIQDEEVYPLSPVPHEVTYGKHVYDKGADVVHTLRSYLGDSLFFYSVNRFLNTMKFKNITSADLRDSLSAYTKIDLTNFFDVWVFGKGFPHFYIYTIDNSNYPKVKVTIKNNPKFNNNNYINVPLEVSFYDQNTTQQTETFFMSYQEQTFEFDCNILPPQFGIIDENRNISDARTMDIKIIDTIGEQYFENGLIKLDIQSVTGKAKVIAEHHWNGPNTWPRTTNGLRYSDYRYWSIYFDKAQLNANASIAYNGRTSGYLDGTNYLDHTLNMINEDSLVLTYRESADKPWVIYDDFIIVPGTSTRNRKGEISINNLKAGDYCLAYRDASASHSKNNKSNNIIIYPNPTSNILNIKFGKNEINNKYKIVSVTGQTVIPPTPVSSNKLKIDINNWKPGQYILEVFDEVDASKKHPFVIFSK